MRYGLAFPLSVVLLASAVAVPPPAPPAFADPQSAALPPPFPVTMVDHGTADPRLKGYLTPAGFKLEVVAEDPVVVNPVGLTFAPDGRLFVLEWAPDPFSDGRWFEFQETVRYRDGTSKQVATMKKFVGDPLKELALDPKTGTYTAGKVVIVDELPSTVFYHDGWIYLTGRGTVRRYKQSRPGGLWDVKETIAQGFCGFHHHQVSGVSLGNDGLLYLTSGDDDNVAEGSDGSRATVMRTGAIFRCRPDGSKLEAYSLGYRNPYRDLAHDAAFNWFHADNDNEDGSKFTGCRLMHVAEGVDYGWRLRPGARCCQPDFRRGAVAGELPGKVPPMLKTGRGSPAGVLIYNDTRLPAHYRGLMTYPDVFRKVIRAYAMKPAGSTFAVTGEFDLLKSDDPLFRPCQMVTGPDGAIYVCDWRTDSGGAGKLWGDGKNGRLYRLSWSGTKEHPAIPLRGTDSWAKLLTLDDEGLVAKLAAADFSDRLVARNELVRRGERVRPLVLRKLLSGSIPTSGRLVAMGVLQQLWDADVADLFRLLLNDDSPDVRRVAADALGRLSTPGDARADAALAKLMSDPHPAVRRSALLAVGHVAAPGAADRLVRAWLADDGKDAFLADATLRAIESVGKPGIDALAKAATSGDPAARDKAVDAFAGCRTKPAFDALLPLLAADGFTPGQRADLVRSALNLQTYPPTPLDPLADFLAARPNEPAAVRAAALDVLADTGLATPAGTKLVTAALTAPEPEVRLAAYQAAEAGRLKYAVPPLLAAAADAGRSPDERVAALRGLRATADRAAAAKVLPVFQSDAPLAVRTEALRTAAALDPAAGRSAATRLLDQTEPTLVAEAVAVLGASKDGAKQIGERFVARKLPPELQPRVSESLRKFASADPAVARLAAEVAKGSFLVTMAPADVAKVKERVAATGNADRGRDIYLNSKTLACVTCHKMEGHGGSVGPDLTRAWDTQSVEKLMEAIVQPSKEIKEGYQAYRLSTAAGQVYTGLKVSESKTEVVLREASGKDVRVPKADIDELVPSKVSLMPDDAVAQLSYDQFIDLIAFLRSREAQESLRQRSAAR